MLSLQLRTTNATSFFFFQKHIANGEKGRIKSFDFSQAWSGNACFVRLFEDVGNLHWELILTYPGIICKQNKMRWVRGSCYKGDALITRFSPVFSLWNRKTFEMNFRHFLVFSSWFANSPTPTFNITSSVVTTTHTHQSLIFARKRGKSIYSRFMLLSFFLTHIFLQSNAFQQVAEQFSSNCLFLHVGSFDKNLIFFKNKNSRKLYTDF